MSSNDKLSTETSDASANASPDIQGEGNYESAHRFRHDLERFLEAADVKELARKAAPKSETEAADMKQAEDIGRSHRAGTDTAPSASERKD